MSMITQLGQISTLTRGTSGFPSLGFYTDEQMEHLGPEHGLN